MLGSFNQMESFASLLGVAFLREQSSSSFANNRVQALSSNINPGESSSNFQENARSTPEDLKKQARTDLSLDRMKSTESFASIGLDLDPSSESHEWNKRSMAFSSTQDGRDLHTPPIIQDCPNISSSPPVLKHTPGPTSDSQVQGSTSVYLSRSDASNVHLTIAKMILDKEQGSPRVPCGS
jgi:hypothetical protein